MRSTRLIFCGMSALFTMLLALPAAAQSFKVQCPTSTTLHPPIPDPSNPRRTIPNPGIKCQHISGGDGYATMADGSQTYLFAFGPLSGMDLIKAGKPGTQSATAFNLTYNATNPNAAITDPAQMSKVSGLEVGGRVKIRGVYQKQPYFSQVSLVSCEILK